MALPVTVTLQNWEKISEEHQKSYKNLLAKAGKKGSTQSHSRPT